MLFYNENGARRLEAELPLGFVSCTMGCISMKWPCEVACAMWKVLATITRKNIVIRMTKYNRDEWTTLRAVSSNKNTCTHHPVKHAPATFSIISATFSIISVWSLLIKQLWLWWSQQRHNITRSKWFNWQDSSSHHVPVLSVYPQQSLGTWERRQTLYAQWRIRPHYDPHISQDASEALWCQEDQ